MLFSNVWTGSSHTEPSRDCTVDGSFPESYIRQLAVWTFFALWTGALSCSNITLRLNKPRRFSLSASLRDFRVFTYTSAVTVDLCAIYSTSRIPWQSQNTVAITLPADGWTRNLTGAGDVLCFHCIDSCFVLGCYQILGKLVLCCTYVLDAVYDTVPKAEGKRKMIR